MRIMSLDVGSRTIGIACSDALLMTAQGIETIRRTSLEKDFNRLQELIAEYEVHELVVGMPKNMNGTNLFHIGMSGYLRLWLNANSLQLT